MMLEKIEEIAKKVLTESGIDSLPVPVETIATKHRIKISRGPSKDFSGLLIRKDGYALIGINDEDAPVQQRFTVAHELGHYFAHESKDTFIDYRGKKGVALTPREREADMFAAALLMPRELLEADTISIARNGFTEEDMKKLAIKYDVSEDAMKYRLLNLNLA